MAGNFRHPLKTCQFKNQA